MADIDITRAHDLGLMAARAAANMMAERLGRKFDLKGDWCGNVMRFERPGLNGSLTLTDRELHLSVTLGFLLKAMRGSIERAVTEQLDALFAEGSGAEPRHAPRARKASVPRKRGG